jgi:hypothetical protein
VTKILIDQFGIDLRKRMAASVCELILGRQIVGVIARGCPEPPLAQDHLMPPPVIERIDLTVDSRGSDPVIHITTADIFGVKNLHVILLDGNRDRIESGEALERPAGSGNWCYIPSLRTPSGRAVNIHTIATDNLGGVGTFTSEQAMP